MSQQRGERFRALSGPFTCVMRVNTSGSGHHACMARCHLEGLGRLGEGDAGEDHAGNARVHRTLNNRFTVDVEASMRQIDADVDEFVIPHGGILREF